MGEAEDEADADGVAANAEATGECGTAVGDWSAVGADGELLRREAMMAMAATATTVPALMPMISRLRRCRRASW